MKDTKEIVLVYNEFNFKVIDVVKELCDTFTELGNPIVLPESDKNTSELFIFNQNPDFQLQSNKKNISFLVNHTYFDNLIDIILSIQSILEKHKTTIKRIGYVSSIILPPSMLEVTKKRYLNLDNLEDMEDFNLSTYRKLDMKKYKINSWERIITDKEHFDDLLVQYDINSNQVEIYKLDNKFIKEFIEVSDKFIESRLD